MRPVPQKPVEIRMKFAAVLLLIDLIYAALIACAAINFDRLQQPGADTPASSYLLYVVLPIFLALACALGQSLSRFVRRLIQPLDVPAPSRQPQQTLRPNTERLAEVARDFAAAGDTEGLTILLPAITHVTEGRP